MSAAKASFHAIRNTLEAYLVSSPRGMLNGLSVPQQHALLDLMAGTMEYLIDLGEAAAASKSQRELLYGLAKHLVARVKALSALGEQQQMQCIGAVVSAGLEGYDMFRKSRMQAAAVAVSGPAAPVTATVCTAWKVYEAICLLAACREAYNACSPVLQELVRTQRVRVLNQLSIESWRANQFERRRAAGMMTA